MRPPNWMLDRGWAVTAEIGGVTARDRLGPQAAPAIAWLRRPSAALTVLLGGRHLDAGMSRVAVRVNGAAALDFDAPSGFFLRRFTIPAGALGASEGYVPLDVSSVGRVSLEQFDAQPPGVPMFGYDRGWHEPEFNATEGRAWRWMSESSDLWVRPIGRDVSLRLVGEDPRRYFDAPPHVRVLMAGREIGSFNPSGDFDYEIALPAALLEAADGRVTIASSRFFVPGGDSGAGDQRHLALRLFGVSVE